MTNKQKKPLLLAMFMAWATCTLSACGGSDATTQTKVEENGSEVDNTTSEKMTAEQGYEKLTINLVEGVIVPLYEQVYASTVTLNSETQAFCRNTSPTHNDLEALQATWKKTSYAWQQARTIKLGPIADTFHYSRIQFWPISSQKLASDVEALLSQSIDFSQGLTNLKHQLQGLPAYEYVLFNSNVTLLDAQDVVKRCEYLQAITANIDGLLSRDIESWKGEYGATFKSGNGSFSSKEAALEKLLTIWFEYLEIIKDNKINEPMSIQAPGKAEMLESAFSQTSLVNIKANIEALERLYTGGDGFGFDDYLKQVNQREDLDTEIRLHFKAIYDALEATQFMPAEQLLIDEQGRAQLNDIGTAITNLRSLMDSDFVQVTGLKPGFNTNDGD
ncbi:imelysin family protein [Pseudoalteromonas sp. T1lg23B]|uniref:imelysin family protein n=1 Tax=Pseudoalteromonas sp. T1lg23B TaxID=2077097 RepID=UPI000CF5E46E|nr:imelysin family protein [Pseudoalteromonas sp. T1lg23B]